jgi:hypothetical protein
MEKMHLAITKSGTTSEFEEFSGVVDRVVMQADRNPELAETIRRIDAECQESGLSFYEVFYNLLAVLNSVEQGNGLVVTKQ